MKLKTLVMAVLAGCALLVSCQQEKPVFGISVDKDSFELLQTGESVQVQVTTAQAWNVKIPLDAQTWLIANPSSGMGNATITFTADANSGKDRKAGVKINAGMAGYAAVTFTQAGALQPGDGLTPETAWSASEARAWIVANLADKEVTTEKYYIKGIIHKVQTTYAASGSYGNATFFISDDGQASSEDFEAYQVYYLEGKQWKAGNPDVAVGDEVIIYGPVTLYGSTPETAGKGAAYVYSHVSKGDPTPGGDDTDYSKAEAKTVAEFIAAAATDTYYKLTGTVSGFNPTYCSFDLEDATGKIYVYSVLDSYKTEWTSKIKNGGTITIAGKYKKYNDKDEVVDAAILAYEDGQGGGDEPKGSGTLADPYNPAKAIAVASALAQDTKSDDVYIKGKVSSVKYTFSAQYGTATFNISEDGTTSGSQFPCYSVYYLGNRAWVEGDAQIEVGNEVVIYGKMINYQGNTPETSSKEAYIYSINGQTEIEPTDTFGVKSAAISVGATATEATISVTGNVAWTAASTDATLDVTAGEGAADIKATFAANTDTENAKTYTVTLTTTAEVATKEIVVTITQGKASSGSGTVLTFQFSDVSGLTGWPTKADEAKDASNQVYKLNGTDYAFSLSPNVYTSTYNNASYLMLASKTNNGPVYLGLPALEGLTLVGVQVKTSSGASKNAGGAVTSDTNGTVVSGGEKKTLGTQSADFSWTLTGTSANTVYYYSSTESKYNSQIVELVLTYE